MREAHVTHGNARRRASLQVKCNDARVAMARQLLADLSKVVDQLGALAQKTHAAALALVLALQVALRLARAHLVRRASG